MSRTASRIVPALLGGGALLVLLPAQASARDEIERFEFEVTGGYRVDQLDWNIAGNIDGNDPNILSELTWEDVESYQVSARGRLVMVNPRSPFGGVVRAGASYGDIHGGDNQDSDYDGDDRTREFSRSNNQADSGNVWDVSLGGGMVIYNRNRTFSISPVVGFSYHEQNLTITDGFQTLNNPAYTPLDLLGQIPAVGPIAGLNSTYDAQWRSGWVGLDAEFVPAPYFNLRATVEFHSGKYEAEADWNLRTDLQHPRSFRHTADDATGFVTGIGMRVGGPNLFFNLDYRYQSWKAEDGIDKTYFSDGTVGVTRFNEVNWEAASVNGGLTLRF